MKKFIAEKELVEAYDNYLSRLTKRYPHLDMYEYNICADEMGSPYLESIPGTREKYVNGIIIDGDEYEMRICWVNEMFWAFNGGPQNCFVFNKYILSSDVKHGTIEEYSKAHCLYSLEVDEEDLPWAY